MYAYARYQYHNGRLKWDGPDFFINQSKPDGLAGRESTEPQRRFRGCPSEPHSSRSFHMPAAATAPGEHAALSGLVGGTCCSSCRLGGNHSSRSQLSGAAFSWTNTGSAPARAFLSSPWGRPTLLYIPVPTSSLLPLRGTPPHPSFLLPETGTSRPPKRGIEKQSRRLPPPPVPEAGPQLPALR